VRAQSFSKTDFALALLAEDPSGWSVPTYIVEGLRWLEAEIAPPELDDNVAGTLPQDGGLEPEGASNAAIDEVAA
jgi:hypothetical protein